MSKKVRWGLTVGCVCGLAALGTSTDAEAAGFYVREHSTSAMITGFAGSASRGDDSSHLFYNPATIIKNSKLDITGDFRTFFPDVEIRGTSATSPLGTPLTGSPNTGNMADSAAFSPAFYASYAITDDLSVGIGGTGPFAVDIEADRAWLGRYQVTKTKMRALNLNPVVAYRIADWITIGGGLQVQHFDANLQNTNLLPSPPAPAPGALSGTGFVKGDGWGVGFTAGVLIEPGAHTTVGVGYRSRVKHKLKGRSGIQAGIPGVVIPDVSSSFDFTSPDILTTSISHKVNDSLALHGTFEWANWSLFEDITVRTPGRVDVRPQNWEDTYSGFGGVSFMYDEQTTIGAGAGYTSAVSDGGSSSISPDGERVTLSVGVSHKLMETLTLKASYAHVFFDDTNLNIPQGASGSLTGKSKIDLHVVGFSGTIHW